MRLSIVLLICSLLLQNCSIFKKNTTTQTEMNSKETENSYPSIPAPLETLAADTKIIITLPNTKLKADSKVVFRIGKSMETDNCNSHGMGGEIMYKGEEIHLSTNGLVRTTMMACPDNTTITKFVEAARVTKEFVPNKEFVFWVPEGFSVEYDILSSQGKQKALENNGNIQGFPKAAEGEKRYVIQLPKEKHERDMIVTILASKNMMVDTCNGFSIQGNFENKIAEGWGYTYYKTMDMDKVISTLRACPTSEKVEKNIQGPTQEVSYNSQVPIVIYTDADVIIEYILYKKEK